MHFPSTHPFSALSARIKLNEQNKSQKNLLPGHRVQFSRAIFTRGYRGKAQASGRGRKIAA